MTIITTKRKITISLKNANGKEIFDSQEVIFPTRRPRMENGAYLSTEQDACNLINWWRRVLDKGRAQRMPEKTAISFTLTVSEKPLTRAEKVARLAHVFSIANEAARRWEMLDDCGTCNFDHPAMRLYGWRGAAVKEAAAMAGVTADNWKGRYYNWHIFGDFKGQAERRSAMADEFKSILQLWGYESTLYCEAD